MNEEVTKFYKKTPCQYIEKINGEVNNITAKMNIGDRVQQLYKKQAFLIVKDHKENFPNNPSFRLINPMQTEFRKISLKILQEMCGLLRITTQVNQWKGAGEVHILVPKNKKKSMYSSNMT